MSVSVADIFPFEGLVCVGSGGHVLSEKRLVLVGARSRGTKREGFREARRCPIWNLVISFDGLSCGWKAGNRV